MTVANHRYCDKIQKNHKNQVHKRNSEWANPISQGGNPKWTQSLWEAFIFYARIGMESAEIQKTIINEDIAIFMWLYPNFSECTIQIFDDDRSKADKSLAGVFPWCSVDGRIEHLLKMNSKWAWIFFSINSMVFGMRNKESVTKINAWVMESDTSSKTEQWDLIQNSPLKPSCIIESQKSYHAYRFAIDWTKEKWISICIALANHFWGDMKVAKDIARVLRLPWFNHMKDPNNPFAVKIVYIDDSLQYTEQQMMDAFKIQESEGSFLGQLMPRSQDNVYKPEEHWFLGYVSMRDNKEMLLSLSGKAIINGDVITFKENTDWTVQIWVNWESTSCRLDKSWLIWSSDKGGPTRIQWVLWYGKSTKKDIIKYIVDNYSHKLPPEYIQQADKTNYVTWKGRVEPVNFAQYLKDSNFFEGVEGNLFKYYPDEWIRKSLNDNEVGQIIIHEAKEFLELDISKFELEAILKFLKVHAESNVIKEKLQYVGQYEISLDDCILDLKTRTTRPFRKDDYKFSKMPFSSKDIADYEKHKPIRTIRFLEEIFASYENPDEIISYIWEVLWHLLLPITKWGNMWILAGGGRNGKGQFLNIPYNILWVDNCCTIQLDKLEDVDCAKLLGKFFAVDRDVSDGLRLDVGILRKIIVGEIVEGRKRYWHPFDFKPYVRIFIAANVDPIIKKMGAHMERRIVYIPFRENFKNRADTELEDKIKKESVGCFLCALDGVKRLLNRWKFIIPAEIEYETRKYLSKFDREKKENIVAEFIHELGLVPGEDILCKSQLYGRYEWYCKSRGLRKWSWKQQLTKVMWNEGFDDKDWQCRGMGIKNECLNMTFINKISYEKSHEDSAYEPW